MNWATKRIDEYRRGERSTWLERRMLEHANPIHFAVSILATASGVYGLWTHDWTFIVATLLLGLIGHGYTWLGTSRKGDAR